MVPPDARTTPTFLGSCRQGGTRTMRKEERLRESARDCAFTTHNSKEDEMTNAIEKAVATGYTDNLLGDQDKTVKPVPKHDYTTKHDFTGYKPAKHQPSGEMPPLPSFLRRDGYTASKMYANEPTVDFNVDGQLAKLSLASADEAADRIAKAVGVMLDVEGVVMRSGDFKEAMMKALAKGHYYDTDTGEILKVVITA